MKTLSCISLFLAIQMFIAIAAKAQEVDVFREKQINANKLLEVKINQLTSESKEANELRQKLVSCQRPAIFNAAKYRETAAFDAAKSNNPAVIKLLELFADNGIYKMYFSQQNGKESPWLVEFYQQQNCEADAALAKAGNIKYFNRIISQTDSSKVSTIRMEAVRKLILIDDNESYKRLYELLDDTTIPKSEADDVQELSISEYVMHLLEDAVTNPPNLKKVYETKDRIILWKKWFQENKGW